MRWLFSHLLLGDRLRSNKTMKTHKYSVLIQNEDINLSNEILNLKKLSVQTNSRNVGALVTFLGTVRELHDSSKVTKLYLEHYPEMTEAIIGEIIENAFERWSILNVNVVHRVGTLTPGENIVFVGVSSSHRKAAFNACEFIMDFLKTKAPFWKKEFFGDRARWVEFREQDAVEARAWVKVKS